jgi:hypothetical protein
MVDLISPVWAATGEKATGDDFDDDRKNQGFIAEQCSYQLINAVIDRDEAKTNEICTSINAYLPTSDQKDAMDGANSPDADNVLATMDDLQFQEDTCVFYDEFFSYMAVDYPAANYLSPRWKYIIDDNGGSNGLFAIPGQGELKIVAADVSAANRTVYKEMDDLSIYRLPEIRFSCKLTYSDNQYINIGLWYDSNNHISFINDYNLWGNNWCGRCRSGGSTSQTSSLAADTDRHDFLIKVLSSSSVEFYVDGALLGELITNIPTVGLRPQFYVESQTTSVRNIRIKYAYIKYLRDEP